MREFTKRAEYTAAIVAVLVPVISGTLWIGSVSSKADEAHNAVAELKADLKQVPADVAVLKVQVSVLSTTLAQLGDEQRKRDEALLQAIKENKRALGNR